MALKENEKNATARKATSTEPGRPLNAHRLMHDATTGHMSEKPSSARRLSHDATGHMDEKSHGHHVDHPHHAHTMLDDHLKTPIDHSMHWTQLLVAKKPHKKDVMEKALATMMHLKKNDDILEKLHKDDSPTLMQTAVGMSRVAGHVASAIQEEPAESKIQEQTKRTPLRSAKSLKRDAALDRLTKVMNECQQPRLQHKVEMMKEKEEIELPVVKRDEEEHREEQVVQEKKESWKILNFDESPKRKRERLETYSVITQRRKTSRPNTPGIEQKGLDLIGVIEVVPHTPPRAQSVDMHTERITVR